MKRFGPRYVTSRTPEIKVRDFAAHLQARFGLMVNQYLHLVQSILSGDARNRGTDDLAAMLDGIDATDPENRELVEFLSSPTTELDELLRSIDSSIDRLFYLAMLIRRDARDRAKVRLLPLTAGHADDPSLDAHRIYIRDKFPKISDKPWLQQKLLQAFSQRRGFIIGRQARQRDMVRADESAGAGDAEKDLSVIATTYEDRSINVQQQDGWDRRSTNSGATSFATAMSEGSDGELDVPDLDLVVFNGVRYEYGETFECPFCRDIAIAKSKHEWR